MILRFIYRYCNLIGTYMPLFTHCVYKHYDRAVLSGAKAFPTVQKAYPSLIQATSNLYINAPQYASLFPFGGSPSVSAAIAARLTSDNEMFFSSYESVSGSFRNIVLRAWDGGPSQVPPTWAGGAILKAPSLCSTSPGNDTAKLPLPAMDYRLRPYLSISSDVELVAAAEAFKTTAQRPVLPAPPFPVMIFVFLQLSNVSLLSLGIQYTFASSTLDIFWSGPLPATDPAAKYSAATPTALTNPTSNLTTPATLPVSGNPTGVTLDVEHAVGTFVLAYPLWQSRLMLKVKSCRARALIGW